MAPPCAAKIYSDHARSDSTISAAGVRLLMKLVQARKVRAQSLRLAIESDGEEVLLSCMGTLASRAHKPSDA